MDYRHKLFALPSPHPIINDTAREIVLCRIRAKKAFDEIVRNHTCNGEIIHPYDIIEEVHEKAKEFDVNEQFINNYLKSKGI